MADVGVAAPALSGGMPRSGMHPQAGSPLAKIPLETLVRMTSFITTQDLCNLRLTCKAIERALFNFFSHEFFSKKQFMAYPVSLQALVDISSHPNLAPCLKHVIICTDRYDKNFTSRTHEGQKALNKARTDQRDLISRGLLRDHLAEAFAKLPNLETVDIRDFNSPTRSRDHTGASLSWWTSYGMRALERQIGLAPSVNGGGSDRTANLEFRAVLFGAMVAALGIANARPKSLEVVMRSDGLDDSAYSIPASLEAPISQMLAGLKKLHVLLLPSWSSSLQPFPGWDMENIRKFLVLSPNVTWLRLNLSTRHVSHHQVADTGASLLCWIAGLASDGKTRLPPTTDVPSFKLDTLDLGDFRLRPAVLQACVRHFSKTLQNISFRRVTLTGTPEVESDRINLWANLIRSLGKLGDLRKLSLALLKQDNHKIHMPHPADPSKQCIERTVKEASSQKIADLAAGLVTPDWPALPPDTGMDIDEDEEDDEDDEDEDEEDEDEAGEDDDDGA